MKTIHLHYIYIHTHHFIANSEIRTLTLKRQDSELRARDGNTVTAPRNLKLLISPQT